MEYHKAYEMLLTWRCGVYLFKSFLLWFKKGAKLANLRSCA